MVFTAGMEFNRSTCDAPGPITASGPNSLIFYFPHPSGLCVIEVFLPSASFSDACWMLYLHGGLGYNTGERAAFDLQAQGAQTKAQYFASKGYVVFSIDYPATSSNRNDAQNFNEVHPLAMWPEQVFYVIAAIQFIMENWIGSSETRYGTRLLGAGNSIDPQMGCVDGISWGCTLAAMAGLTPEWMIPRFASPKNTQEPWRSTTSHRNVRCWAGSQGQIDLTQFDIEPLGLASKPDYPLGEIYMNDRAQWLNRVDSTRLWSTTPIELKKLSPWWMLKRGYPENSDTSFFMQWPTTDLDIPEEANLTSADWSPGTVPTAASRLAGKAWRDPHHPFQAAPWRDALLTYGTSSSALIRKSQVNAGTPATFAERLHLHLKTNCGFPY